jgi:hypothetical protein
MHLILLLMGAVLAAAGVAMLRYAVPVEDVAGAALFTSGVVAIVGALILAALAAAVRSLGRIAERLNIQPLPVPPVAAVGREDPAPRPVRAAPATAAAAAARPSLLGWLGRGSSPAPVRAARASAPAKPEPEPAAPAPVDLAPLTRIPETAPPPPPVPPPPLRPPPRPAPNGAATTVYRSGVIDGMAYSLFMDGSIEAELPTGKVRFATIEELQQYLVSRKS